MRISDWSSDVCSSDLSAEPAPISFTPAPGTRNADPGSEITVSAPEGILAAVTMTNEQGTQIEGVLTPDKSTWKPLQPLGYGHTYTVKIGRATCRESVCQYV